MLPATYLPDDARLSASRDAPLVPRLVERQMRARPGDLAVRDGARSLTYGELDARSAALGGMLQARGIGAESRVGVHLPHSLEYVVALAAVSRAGAAYVALDPTYPKARLERIVEDAQLALVLTGAGGAAPAGAPALAVEDARLASAPPLHAASPAHPQALAYLVYTSGSTGQPKGAMIHHGALANFVAWYRAVSGLGPRDRVPLVAATSFDLSVADVWPTLAAGATILVPDADTRMDPDALGRWLRDEGATVAMLPTPYGDRLLPRAGSPLRVVHVAGDRLRRDPRGAVAPRLLNDYGPAEATVAVTSLEVRRGDPAPTIGCAIDGLQVHVLDAALRPVQDGELAELWIGGAGVGRGYCGQPRLTAERFVPDPLALAPGGRLYRTGDLGRSAPSGEIEFAGRADHQVKLRGFRIELGEIETLLSAQPGVRDAVVVVQEQGAVRRLVAYVEADAPGPPLVPADLTAALGRELPGYMVPSRIVVLARLPRLASTKVDRKALPKPDDVAGAPREEGGARAVAGAPPDEDGARAVAAVFASVLGVEAVGAGEDFFVLGGDSLLATDVVARLRASAGLDVSLRDFVDNPTPAGLAHRLRPAGPATLATGTSTGLSEQQRYFWFMQQMSPDAPMVNILATLRAPAPIDAGRVALALRAVLERHACLRSRFRLHGERLLAEPMDPASVQVQDARAPDADAAVGDARARAGETFDLAAGPPARCVVYACATGETVIALVVHHIAADGVSLRVAFDELAAGLDGRPLAGAERDYASYVRWQESEHDPQPVLDHWCERLISAGEDRSAPAEPGPARQELADASALVACARRHARAHGVTLTAALLAGFQRALPAAPATIGLIAANRPPGFERVVGPFVRLLPVALRGPAPEPLAHGCRRMHRELVEALPHQELPLDRLEAEMRRRGHAFHLPSVILNIGHSGDPPPMLEGAVLDWAAEEHGGATTSGELAVRVRIDGAQAELALDVRDPGRFGDLRAAALVEAWAGAYEREDAG